MKKGSKVRLKYKPNGVTVTGTVVAGANRGAWTRETPKFLVEYDGEFIPPQDWHPEGFLELLSPPKCHPRHMELHKGFHFDYEYCPICDRKYYLNGH